MYQANFFSTGMDGALVCPRCKGTHIHPTGHTMALDTGDEYGPTVGVVGWCECGATVEIRIGCYKGDLAMDIVDMNPME